MMIMMRTIHGQLHDLLDGIRFLRFGDLLTWRFRRHGMLGESFFGERGVFFPAARMIHRLLGSMATFCVWIAQRLFTE